MNEPSADSEPSATFWHDLHLADDALTSKTDTSYKTWLTEMFTGITCLARTRGGLLRITETQQTRLDEWPNEWRDEVAKASPNKYRDRKARFLQTRSNFQYLAKLFVDESDKSWYLVSVAPREARTLKLNSADSLLQNSSLIQPRSCQKTLKSTASHASKGW